MIYDCLVHATWEPGLFERTVDAQISFPNLTKYPEPILSAQAPWEYHWLELGRNSVIYDKQEKLFKMWYRAADPDHPERQSWYAKTFLRCYAVSENGVNWHRPHLGLFSHRGSTANNIISEDAGDGFFCSVIKDSQATDSSKLYKAMGFGEYAEETGIYTGFSPDGVNWTRGPRVFKSTEAADGASLLDRHPLLNQWMALVRPRTNPKKRFLGISFSDDFQHWSRPQIVLAAGANDRIGVEYDNLTLCWIDGYFVGLIGTYYTAPDDQRYNSGVAFSYDGLNWNQPTYQPVLDFSEKGNWDDSMVRPSAIVRKDDDLYIYYWGANRGQGTMQVPVPAIGSKVAGRIVSAAIGLVRMPVHRFALLEPAQDAPCLAETKFLSAATPDLCINADTTQGQIRVKILDHRGQPLPGFQFDDFIAVKGQNATSIECKWKNQRLDYYIGNCTTRDRIGRVLKIVFEITNSKLYSFSFNES